MSSVRRQSLAIAATLVAVSPALVGCSANNARSSSAPTGAPSSGGSITVGGYLASGYKYSNDGLTLTVSLRPEPKFSDGTPLDATAAAWNLNRYVTNGTREKTSSFNVTSINASGDTKVVITFSAPNSLVLDAMATSSTGFMVSPRPSRRRARTRSTTPQSASTHSRSCPTTTDSTTNIAESTKLWHNIWTTLTTQGFAIPIVSTGDYVASSPKLKGVENLHNYGDYTHAYLTK